MEEPPSGYRRPEDEALFRQQTEDTSIEPDLVTPAVEGYFRIPAVWVGQEPPRRSGHSDQSSESDREVLRQHLSCGIEACVKENGTFLFDFSR